MYKIQLECPSCGKMGLFDASEELIKNAPRGILAFNIAKNTICSHSFIAYIDKNLKVRDYFVSDFHIEIPETPSNMMEKIKDIKIPEKHIFDLDLIKLNIHALQLSFILKSIFLKQKIALIYDEDYIHNHILKFFEYINQNSFEMNIGIISKEEYLQNKKIYKDSMVFEQNDILNNAKKLINSKKLYIERLIVSRFLTELDLGYSYIYLKNEILKAYELSKSIVDIINESKEKNENPNIIKITQQLEELYHIKIGREYLNFLLDIVKNYFNTVTPSYSDSFINSF